MARLNGHREWIDLDFVKRERTPELAMELGIQSHVAGLLLSNTAELLDFLGVQRSRKAVHDWVQKADLQPESGRSPNQIALDETVIRINDQQFWLYAIERVFRELMRRNSSFSNCFSHVEPATAENWLQRFARWLNATN